MTFGSIPFGLRAIPPNIDGNDDLQCAGIILLCCSSKANFDLRSVHGEWVGRGVPNKTIQNCIFLFWPFDIDATHAGDVANMPFSIGGLGLKNATRNYAAIFWVSWAHDFSDWSCNGYHEIADEISIA